MVVLCEEKQTFVHVCLCFVHIPPFIFIHGCQLSVGAAIADSAVLPFGTPSRSAFKFFFFG